MERRSDDQTDEGQYDHASVAEILHLPVMILEDGAAFEGKLPREVARPGRAS